MNFSIAPDGTQFAYDYGGEFSSINLRNIASGDEISLQGQLTEFGAQWSPDGSMIAYITKWGYGLLDIYVTEPDPSVTPYLLYDDDDFNSLMPVWSPDSEKIAFLGAYGELDENNLNDEEFDIYVIDVNGDNLINISDHPARDAEPVWQPTTP